MRWFIAVVALGGAIIATLAIAGSPQAPARLRDLYRAHDFFALRAAIPAERAGETREISYLRAASLSAFRAYDDAIRILNRLLQDGSRSSAEDAEARTLLMLDLRAQYHYAAALRAVEPLALNPNRARMLAAIADVPPQTIHRGGGGSMPLGAKGQLAVRIGGHRAQLQLDTGANFSVLSRRVATSLGLRLRPPQFSISSPLGGRTRADVTTAGILFDDGTRVENVIFIVLPDVALRGSGLDGLLGMPVLAQLGAFAIRGRHIAFGGAPIRGVDIPLALSGSDPMLSVRHRNGDMICRLDTGAERSLFSSAGVGASDMAARLRRPMRLQTVAGVARVNAVAGEDFTIFLGTHAIRLRHPLLFRGADGGSVPCNLGRDILSRFPAYAIDLSRLTLTLASR